MAPTMGSKPATQKSCLMLCSINHPLLVTVIQALPQCNNSACPVVAETERGLL